MITTEFTICDVKVGATIDLHSTSQLRWRCLEVEMFGD
jgi:hypothetical protein